MVAGWVSKGPDHVVACVLRGIRGRIGDRRAWTFGVRSRDAHGDSVPLDVACKWCVSGALDAEVGETGALHRAVSIALDESACREPSGIYGSRVQINDYLGHDATIRMVDRAIARAEKLAEKRGHHAR